MRTRLGIALLVVVAVFGACYRGPDPDLTETGKGRPDVSASYPERAEAGDTVELVVEVTNPGPGDMASVVVAFSRLGDPSLPAEIVEVGRGGRSEGIASVEPSPEVISPEGVIFRFGGLPEGESASFTFELVIPEVRDEVGNAVTVYDGSEPERARGARVLISVE